MINNKIKGLSRLCKQHQQLTLIGAKQRTRKQTSWIVDIDSDSMACEKRRTMSTAATRTMPTSRLTQKPSNRATTSSQSASSIPAAQTKMEHHQYRDNNNKKRQRWATVSVKTLSTSKETWSGWSTVATYRGRKTMSAFTVSEDDTGQSSSSDDGSPELPVAPEATTARHRRPRATARVKEELTDSVHARPVETAPKMGTGDNPPSTPRGTEQLQQQAQQQGQYHYDRRNSVRSSANIPIRPSQM